MPLETGQRAPAFRLLSQHRQFVELSDFAGSELILVFMPFAFTRTCEGEMCTLRDNLDHLQSKGAKVVVITCDTNNSNRVWAEQHGFTFPILSDFWPHGEVARSYDSFDEQWGYAKRTTYFIDGDGVITDVIASPDLRTPRDPAEYEAALGFS